MTLSLSLELCIIYIIIMTIIINIIIHDTCTLSGTYTLVGRIWTIAMHNYYGSHHQHAGDASTVRREPSGLIHKITSMHE